MSNTTQKTIANPDYSRPWMQSFHPAPTIQNPHYRPSHIPINSTVGVLDPGEAACFRRAAVKILIVSLCILIPIVATGIVASTVGDKKDVIITAVTTSAPLAITLIVLSILKCKECIHRNTYVPIDESSPFAP